MRMFVLFVRIVCMSEFVVFVYVGMRFCENVCNANVCACLVRIACQNVFE